MSDPKQTLSPAEVSEAGLTGWRQDGETIVAAFDTGDFASGLDLVNRIGAAAEEADHHPDLTLTYSQVAVTLSSHDVGGITSRDIDLARKISGYAADLGAAPAAP
ncbi:4a-hydroxytetrahydrobiopterin dehydratase [Actinomycetota bacterium]